MKRIGNGFHRSFAGHGSVIRPFLPAASDIPLPLCCRAGAEEEPDERAARCRAQR